VGKRQVLCTLRFKEGQLNRLRQVSPALEVRQQTCRNADEVSEALTTRDEILYTFFSPTSLAVAPNLKWVQLHSAGADHLLDTPLWQSDIPITNASGVHATTIGEYVIGSMLAHSRHFPRLFAHQQRAEWPENRWQKFVGQELRGKTLCVVGYGSIGREVARLASAFGMRVVAVKNNPRWRRDRGFCLPGAGDPEGRIPETIYGPRQLDKALAQVDYVVVTVPSTPQTRPLIKDQALRTMPRHAYLVNVSRGDVLDQEALIAALRDARIGGAGLDVFDPEPLPAESPLWRMDNVIISPHISGFTPNYDDHAVTLFSQNLQRYLKGRTLLNEIDRERGY
jgi:phosphoglycerate dehydrogenase-like enzyme